MPLVNIGKLLIRPAWVNVPWYRTAVIEALAWEPVYEEPIVVYFNGSGELLAVYSERLQFLELGLKESFRSDTLYRPDSYHYRKDIREEYVDWIGAYIPLSLLEHDCVEYLDLLWDKLTSDPCSNRIACWWIWEQRMADDVHFRFLARVGKRHNIGVLWLHTPTRKVFLDKACVIERYSNRFRDGEIRRLKELPFLIQQEWDELKKIEYVLGHVFTPKNVLMFTRSVQTDCVFRYIALAFSATFMKTRYHLIPFNKRPRPPKYWDSYWVLRKLVNVTDPI